MRNSFINIQYFFTIAWICLITNMPVWGTEIPQKYSVTYFSTQNGVEDGLVNDIIQDHKGLLWFATWNGLYRFDGYNFKNYKSNIEDQGGLTNDRLLKITEDKFGCIWTLCYDSTCYRFNPDKEIFEPIIQHPSANFQSITVLSNGIVWLLRKDRFHLLEADNGEEGLKKAFSELPDIIITDVMMPVLDGIQMLQELRNDERTSHIPAIVLTAKADMDSILIGIHTGADDYITKPFSLDYLDAKVETLLAGRSRLQAYYTRKAGCVVEEDVQNEKDMPQLSEKDSAFLDKLALIMEKEMSNPDLNIDQLVSNFSLSRTNFFHKLKSLTGLSPILYIKEVRMRKAAELIKENRYTMAEIAYMVGFSDPHYFSKSFKNFWGMTSTEFAKSKKKI